MTSNDAAIYPSLTMTLNFARKLAVFMTGGVVLLVGVAMVVLPGPAILVIPAGLGILATEFVWARRLLRRIQDEVGAKLDRGQPLGQPAPDAEVAKNPKSGS